MSSPEKILLAADRLNLTRRGKHILRDVSLMVGERDFVTVVGPNGAGKSMLLKALMGLEVVDSGTVTRAPDLRLGYVPQRLVPDPAIPLTVRRFLYLRKRVPEGALLQVAEETGVAAHLDCALAVLSGGELQRVLLARALLDSPDLLVLDEPAQNLDVGGQLAFYKLLEKLYRERGFSILMVSHDLHLVMASTRRVVCLFHHVCCSGEPHVVTRDPEFTALFGDDMARMMAVYHHEHHHDHEEEGHHHHAHE